MKNFRAIKISILRRLSFLNKIKYKSSGKRSIIYKPIAISGERYIAIGNGVSLFEGARIEAIASWKDQKLNPSISIGDNTSFEQSAHIISGAKLTIGHDCVFSSRVFIASAEHSYEEINLNKIKLPLRVGGVKIGDYCFIGMDVKIFPGVSIGDNVIIGSNSIVKSDLPSYSVCAGTPAKVIKKYNFETKEWEKVR